MTNSNKITKMNKRNNRELTEKEELSIERSKKGNKHSRKNRTAKRQDWSV